jgi:hypothetical protein
VAVALWCPLDNLRAIALQATMIFEAELGIKPSDWLKYAPLDDFLADNRIPMLPFEEAALSISGLHISLLRLIFASLISILAGILHRFVPTATGAPLLPNCR